MRLYRALFLMMIIITSLFASISAQASSNSAGSEHSTERATFSTLNNGIELNCEDFHERVTALRDDVLRVDMRGSAPQAETYINCAEGALIGAIFGGTAPIQKAQPLARRRD